MPGSTAMHRVRARLDVYAHNPYPLDPKRETPLHAPACESCTTVTMATLSRLERLVALYFPAHGSGSPNTATRATRRTASSASHLCCRRAMSPRARTRAYRAPRVDMLIHFLYRDEPTLARFQSGLARSRNTAGPALAAFELPLAETARSGSTTSLWGQLRAPDVGSSAVLERQTGGSWRSFARVSVSARG